LYFALGNFVRARKLGRVLPPGAFELDIPGEVKDTVRSPDLAFLTQDKIAGPPGAIKDIPDLAVEVHSPNDEPHDLTDKLKDYQAAGWNLVWVIYPPQSSPKRKAGTVDIYRLQEETRINVAETIDQDAVLLGEGILDGFKIPVKELFE
jgi:Uma2 family endonuclease